MKYLTFIRHSESYRKSPPPPALLEAMGKFVEKSLKEGTLVDTGGLLPSKEGVRVRLANVSPKCGRCSTPAWAPSAGALRKGAKR